MSTQARQRNVLMLGRSQLVLDEIAATLRERCYGTAVTNNFSELTSRFDVSQLDLVSFGRWVPPEREAESRRQIAAINPSTIFVRGLAGIPGLIIDQVEGAFVAAGGAHTAESPIYDRHERAIRLALAEPAAVSATLYWRISSVSPDPRSDSLVLLDERLGAGDHMVAVPDHIPAQGSFAAVRIGAEIYAFSIAGDESRRRPPRDHQINRKGTRK